MGCDCLTIEHPEEGLSKKEFAANNEANIILGFGQSGRLGGGTLFADLP